MIDMHRHIRNKFRIKGFNIVPYTGWLESTREHIAELFAEFGFKVGAEIGVRYGEFSAIILQKNPGVKLYCVDTWAPYPGGRPDQAKQDRIYRHARRLLEPLGGTLIKKPSMDALADIPDGSLDFVYIDALHNFDYVMMDIICWSKKVKSGGIVSGHDYVELTGCEVIPAVRAYTEGHGIRDWYITAKDIWHSYFWVNP